MKKHLFPVLIFASVFVLLFTFQTGTSAEDLDTLRERAEQGDAIAQFNLGVMYDNGRGVTQDYARAIAWYKKAAEQGNASAQFNLGLMYAKGRGVPQDYVRAHMWWNLAAALGDEDAMEFRDDIAKKMAPGQVASAQDAARVCLARDYKGC